MDETTTDNPVLRSYDRPYGLPDFGAIDDEDFLPAFSAAMAEHLAEIEAIAENPEPATFANTIEALERSGRSLAQASGIFFNLVGPDTNPRRNEIAVELSTRLTDHGNTIAMNPTLFARIADLNSRAEALELTEPQERLLAKRYRAAVRSGAALTPGDQQRMREISGRLALLSTTFSQRVLDDSNASAVLVDTAAELAGMSDAGIAAARRAASDAGHNDGYLLTLELPTSQSALTELTDPATRRRLFAASIARNSRGNEHDTRELLLEMVRLRARRAELLGYATHADYVIAEETAPDPAAVDELLRDMVSAATAAGARELGQLEALAGGPIEASDVTFWLSRQQRATAAVPIDGFVDYCELDAVLTDGVFYAAGVLYGLTFTERTDLSAYHPDVRVWEVFGEDGAGIGLYLGDFFARPSKRGGAWMNNIVDQSLLLGTPPVVVNVLNLTKPDPGEPCLLTIDQLTTLFHEFGHALHGLLSAVDYPSQSGTSVPRDFVEFPSQVNEMWALHPQVLGHYARHHRTGEAIPEALAQAVRQSSGADSAHGTIEYLAASVLDLAWHRVGSAAAEAISDVETFEAEALAAAGLSSGLIPPRYRSAYFNHIFGGGYSAGYYSYIWSEVLDAETEQWFLAEGGLLRASGRRFAESTLSRGDSVDPLVAHRGLIGRQPQVEPLLRRRGLAAV